MGMEKAIASGKERRKPFRGAKAIDTTCRNHGSCPYCRSNRTHKQAVQRERVFFWRRRDMMTKQELIDATKNVAWTTRDNPLNECFTRLRETISSRSADDKHQLNAENVTGVWYLSSFVNEEAPNAQLLVRSRLETGSYERLLLSSEICKIVGNDDEYDFDAEYLRDGSMLKGTQEQLYDAFLQGKVFAIYDSERSDAK